MTDQTETTCRRAGNPRLDEQRNTDTTNANRQRMLNTDKYSRELFRELTVFLTRRPPEHKMSDFVKWLTTKRKYTSRRGKALHQEGVKRALKRVCMMEPFSLQGEGHECCEVVYWEHIVKGSLGKVGLEMPHPNN
jgi:hypothetical protein